MDSRYYVLQWAPPRRRRDCLGELVQIDGSEHAWFEARGEMCTLLAFMDDATSRLNGPDSSQIACNTSTRHWPGTSDCATARSLTGNSGCPVSRFSIHRKPTLVGCATAGMSCPSRFTSISVGCAGGS